MAVEALRVDNLYCERDERVLFDGLRFTVTAGDVVRIEGQNGSGKTTLLRMLSGLSNHYEGDIYWGTQLLVECADEYRQNLLYFGHQAGVKALLTPLENLHWYASMQPHINVDKLDWALEQVGLRGFEDVPCYTLSAGQNRRVSLARLYLSSAPVWILDEPFTAIDKQGVATLEQLITDHAIQGGMVILTTHHELAMAGTLRKVNLDQLANRAGRVQ